MKIGIFAAGLTSICAVALLAQRPQATGGDVRILPVQGNIYMLAGAGGNITLQVGKDGLLLVDTGTAQMSDKVVAAIRTISNVPFRFIMNTNMHADHTGGNAAISKLGNTIADNNFLADIAGRSVMPGAKIIAHEQVLHRMTAAASGDPSAVPGWPNDTYIAKQKKFFINGEAVVLYHEPSAHTDGDSVVFFRRSDVISAGDLLDTDSYPLIDLANGGNIQGVIAGLNHIIELAVPADKQEGGTYIVPGHGRLCDQADVVEYQTMLTIVRERIQDLIKKGMTLDQVKAAKPTFDYDNRYGRKSGSWTTDMFIEAVYKSLKK